MMSNMIRWKFNMGIHTEETNWNAFYQYKKHIEEKQCFVPDHHISLKSKLLINMIVGLLNISLQRTLGLLELSVLSRHSLALSTITKKLVSL